MHFHGNTYNEAQRARAELENRILKGIAEEWRVAVDETRVDGRWLSSFVKPPVFQLSDMEALGTWNRQTSTIAMQRRFVLEHPWEAVVDVLKHEMAHQLADQILNPLPDEPPHGAAFRKACTILHIQPRASGDYKTLRESLQEGADGESDRLLVKIRKLLALAEGGETFEAEAALAKAQYLISRHQIDLVQLKRRRNFFSIFLTEPAVVRDHVLGSLSLLLSDFYYVEAIWTTAWVVEKGRFGRALEISGTSDNLSLAEYVFHFVMRFIDSSWQRFTGSKKLGARRKRDFGIGVVEGFRKRLQAELETMRCHEPGERGIILWRDPELYAYYRFRHPRISSTSRSYRQDKDSFNAGLNEGARLTLREGISDKSPSGPRLLPAPE